MLLKFIIPRFLRTPMRFVLFKFKRQLDAEMFQILNYVNDRKLAIDIGANVGIYSYYFAQKFDQTFSFEPLEDITVELKAYSTINKRLKVHNCALSDYNGENWIFTPKLNNGFDYGLTSFTESSDQHKRTKVQVRTLDSFSFTEVSLLKVDVEGWEYSVLMGAQLTIARCKPVIFIEIEQRHLGERKIDEIFRLIESFGYRGLFFNKTRFETLNNFDLEENQLSYLHNVHSDNYLNNFLFFPV